MSFIDTKSKFHVALDGQGLILQGASDRLAYKMEQAPIYGNRFASGDRSYNDLSQWWYFVQTSWVAGFKDGVSWADDAKYYYSINIDPFSEEGSLRLSPGINLTNTFADEIVVGSYETPIATAYRVIGTNQAVSTKPAILTNITVGGAWTNISSVWMPTTADLVSEVLAHKLKFFFSTIGAGATYVVGACNEDGTGNVDHSAAIGVACDAITLANAYCLAEDGNSLWAGVAGTTAQNYITKTIDGGTTWTKMLSLGYEKVLCILPVNGDVYFLTLVGNVLRFKFYDTTAAAATTIYTFPAETLVLGNAGSTGTASRRALTLFNNKVIISKRGEVWSYSISTGAFERIYQQDGNKTSISSLLATSDPVGVAVNSLHTGAVFHSNKLWWQNLIYTVQGYFYNSRRDATDADATYSLKPLFSDGSSLFWTDNNNFAKLYVDSGFKGSADKNYLVFNNFDLLSGIDKLAYTVTIIFKPLIAGQSIVIEYLLGELTSDSVWTSLGTASFTADGGTVTDKTFFFNDSVTFKKIWIRVKLNSGESDTPTMTDFVMAFLPSPTFKKGWALNINCGDDLRRLDGGLVETTGRELKGRLERAWWTKSVLDFQDIDYATTLVNDASLEAGDTTITVDNTADFPEQGRVRIDVEEITYTGKTPTTFTGCTRGARGTRAVAHADDSVINNAYKVILTDFSTKVPIFLEDNELEYIVGISLREV